MARNKKTEVELTFRLANIEVLELNIPRQLKPLDEGQPVHFNIGMEHRFDISNKVVFVSAMVNVIDSPENEALLANMVTSCNFIVENLHEFVEPESNKVQFPESIIIALNSIAISTTRGILYSELKGTYLHGAILPVLDPKMFAKLPTGNL